MSKKPKVAVVLRELPIPIHAGLHLVVHHHLHGLIRNHDVKVFVLDKSYGSDLADYFVSYQCYSDYLGLRTSEAIGTQSRRLSRIAKYYRVTKEKLSWLQESLEDYRPDVVLGYGYDLAPYFGQLPATFPKVLNLVDSEILYHWRQILTGDVNWGRIKHLIASIATATADLRSCDSLITVSAEDTKNIKRFVGNVDTYTISNGVDTDFFRPNAGDKKTPGRIIFTGSLSWAPNRDAISWFLDRCWTAIQNERPDASLTIIGKEMSPDLRLKWERHRNVSVVGFVPDIRQYICSAEVSIAPMVSGSGVKNKVLEAWSLRQAVVATPLVANGLRCSHGDNILLGQNPQQFAAQVIRVLSDESLRDALGNSGRQNVLAHYTWEAVHKALSEVINSTIERCRTFARN